MWQTGPSSEGAFTLLEVLVVLMILSLVGTVAAVSLPNTRDRVKLAEACAWLNRTLADTRAQARRQGRMRWVEFDVNVRRYRISDAEWRALPSGVTWSLEHRGPAVGSTPAVTFFSDGTGSEAVIAMQAGAYLSVRRIGWLTGSNSRAQY